LVKNQDFGQSTEILPKNPNFGKKFNLNQILGQKEKSNFWSTIEIFSA